MLGFLFRKLHICLAITVKFEIIWTRAENQLIFHNIHVQPSSQWRFWGKIIRYIEASAYIMKNYFFQKLSSKTPISGEKSDIAGSPVFQHPAPRPHNGGLQLKGYFIAIKLASITRERPLSPTVALWNVLRNQH